MDSDERQGKVDGKIPAGVDPDFVDHAPAEISSPSNDPSFPPPTSSAATIPHPEVPHGDHAQPTGPAAPAPAAPATPPAPAS